MSEAVADSVLTGMGVVIDNHVHAKAPEEDLIADLLDQIREANIPCVLYDKLPPLETCRNLANVAFIVLDWELWEKPVAELGLAGVATGSELQRQGIQENITFLQSLKGSCFAPVFIFSYLDPDGIKTELRNAGLLGADDNHAFILVRTKSDLKRTADQPGQRLLAAVNAWVAGNPSIYVLSHWKDAVTRSQNCLFWDLYDKDPAWPSVLWDAYRGEGDDPEHGLADILLRNMRARLFPLSLKPELVAPPASLSPDLQTTQAVLEASMIVPHERLPASQYGCGDMFKGSKQRYWINIRCDCDCIQHGDGDADTVVLYLLEAQPITNRKLHESFNETYGLLQTKPTSHVLFPVQGKALRVDFAKLCQVRVGDLEKHGVVRVGRLTPPYITQIRQRFALHLQREGLPRIPNAAVPPDDAGAQ